VNALLVAALWYLGIGLAPVPIRKDKSVNLATWKEYQERLPTEDEVSNWFNAEQHGVGLVCGEVSGNLVRLDFDDPQDYEELGHTLPESAPTFKSQRPGGGYGVLTRTPEPFSTLPQKTFEKYPKLEVRGEGAITIVPPTPGYEWLTGHRRPVEMDILQWLKDNAGYEPEKRPKRLAEVVGIGPSAAERDAEFASLLADTEEPGRHNALLRLAGRLRWYGIGLEFAIALLMKHARDWPYRDKRMGEAEIRKTVESVYRYGGMAPDLARRLEAEEYRPPTLAELGSKGLEGGEPIAEGLLHRGDLLLIWAGAGVGKSTRTENMAAQIASGCAVFGVFPVPRPCKVMMWELENPAYEVIERMDLLRRTYPFTDDSLRVDAFPGMDIADPIWQKKLAQGLSYFRPDVLIMEPLAAMHNRDENSSTEMRQVLGPLKEAASEYGVAVVLCHHRGWHALGEAKHPRGSSAIVDIVTTSVEVEDMGEYASRFIFTKSRSISRAPLQEVELKYDPETHVLALADPRELRKAETVFAMTKLRTGGWTLQAIADAVGVTKSMASRCARGESVLSEENFQKLKELRSTPTQHLPHPE